MTEDDMVRIAAAQGWRLYFRQTQRFSGHSKRQGVHYAWVARQDRHCYLGSVRRLSQYDEEALIAQIAEKAAQRAGKP